MSPVDDLHVANRLEAIAQDLVVVYHAIAAENRLCRQTVKDAAADLEWLAKAIRSLK